VSHYPERLLIQSSDYQFLTALLRARSGLALGFGKEYILESRLPPVASAYGFASVEELITALRDRPHYQLEKAVCDAMSTGETLFFRDGAPFDFLRTTLVPQVAERCRAERRSMRIWSVATATGQEAYSVAIILDQLAPVLSGLRVEVLATDFVTQSVNRARRGVYTPDEVARGLTPELLARYFIKREGDYVIDQSVRRKITFSELNLLDTFDALGLFDIILCRNVLLYFDAATKKDIVERMTHILRLGGYFFLGSTETAFDITDRLVRISGAPTTVYTLEKMLLLLRDRCMSL
jgi:chemotaxis protein methyltransferase CheR